MYPQNEQPVFQLGNDNYPSFGRSGMLPGFQAQGMNYPVFTQPVEQNMVSNETPLPYTYSSMTDSYPSESFEWNPTSIDRQPPSPTGLGFNPWEQRLRRIERQQVQMQREINQLDRRLRTVERRLGIPAPHGPFYGAQQ